MAATAIVIQDLHGDVLKFSLEPNQSLSQFSYPKWFENHCKEYLNLSPPAVLRPRFSTLNFDGFIVYNYHNGPEGKEFEKECTSRATLEDVKNWKTAIKCLQRYCLNLILAPKRQDFHHIKVSPARYIKAKCSQTHFSSWLDVVYACNLVCFKYWGFIIHDRECTCMVSRFGICILTRYSHYRI